MVNNNKFVAEKNNCGLKNKDINKERMMRMEKKNKYALFEITPEIEHFAGLCEKNTTIEKDLYSKYEVKRGLRDVNGKGVLAGLTNISDVCATKIVDGKEVPCAGNLYYRGYNIKDLVRGFLEDGHFGFEEIAYLLLFGELPTRQELADFQVMLSDRRTLPPNFVRDVIMKAPSRDMMNSITRSILQLYSYDDKADDTSIPNVLRQSLNLISQFPMLMVYSYLAYNYRMGEDLYIYAPKKELSMAENILMMLREDRQYTELEAKILDMALVLHMDHGGGNNSTFTTHVVTSSGTDTYSTIAAAMASLKGPKHGGANVKVTQMFEDMKTQLTDWQDDDQIRAYLEALLEKRAFDKRGLIYGMGHAIYSVSDPRAEIFKKFVKQLAYEKGHEAEYALYEKVEKMAPEIISERRKMYKGVNANVDFYSGLVYSMLDLPPALYTPIFAAARIVGWSAHRLEELKNVDKIIRPAYKPLAPYRDYIKLDDR
jgi:citrate synthase